MPESLPLCLDICLLGHWGWPLQVPWTQGWLLGICRGDRGLSVLGYHQRNTQFPFIIGSYFSSHIFLLFSSNPKRQCWGCSHSKGNPWKDKALFPAHRAWDEVAVPPGPMYDHWGERKSRLDSVIFLSILFVFSVWDFIYYFYPFLSHGVCYDQRSHTHLVALSLGLCSLPVSQRILGREEERRSSQDLCI